jgi:hypothetical protein
MDILVHKRHVIKEILKSAWRSRSANEREKKSAALAKSKSRSSTPESLSHRNRNEASGTCTAVTASISRMGLLNNMRPNTPGRMDLVGG